MNNPENEIQEFDEKEVKNDKERKSFVFGEVLSYLLYFFGAIVVTILILTFVGQRMVVNGPSMENTLFNGESVIVDKLSYRFSDPKRFDIVVFPYKFEEKTDFIKRVIGLPGETVEVVGGEVFIDSCPVEESYVSVLLGDASPLLVPEQSFYVLGDNREEMYDSRMEEVGCIPADQITGIVEIRLYPLDQILIFE